MADALKSPPLVVPINVAALCVNDHCTGTPFVGASSDFSQLTKPGRKPYTSDLIEGFGSGAGAAAGEATRRGACRDVELGATNVTLGVAGAV